MSEELQDNPELCDNSPMQADLNPRSDMTAQTAQLDKTFPEEVTAPAGTYWVGDPCYSVPDERWMEWLVAAEYDHPDRDRTPLIAKLDGLTVVGVSTEHGDGDYPSYSLPEKGREIKFWVDAGLIGLVPVALAPELEEEEGLRYRVEFSTPVRCHLDSEGYVNIGHISIATAWEDEDEYDEYEDDEYEDDGDL